MPRYIAKFTDKETGKDYYCEWSTLVDAPVTGLVDLDTFKAYYLQQYGENGMVEFEERMQRVSNTGVSARYGYDSVQELIEGNRSGDNESELTYEQIMQEYRIDLHNDNDK